MSASTRSPPPAENLSVDGSEGVGVWITGARLRDGTRFVGPDPESWADSGNGQGEANQAGSASGAIDRGLTFVISCRSTLSASRSRGLDDAACCHAYRRHLPDLR